MGIGKKIGIAVLAVVWLALGVVMLARTGITLYNLLIIIISGCIVFIPLWKKYFNNDRH